MITAHYGYEWRVIYDPSGDFSGRKLRLADLTSQPGIPYPYEDGVRFKNDRTGAVMCVIRRTLCEEVPHV